MATPEQLTRKGGLCVRFVPAVHECAFEVVEAAPSVLFSSTKKAVFRAPSQDAMVDWVVALHDAAEGAAATAALLLAADAAAGAAGDA